MKIEIADECIEGIVRKEMKNIIDYNLDDIRGGRLGAFSTSNLTYNDLCLSQLIAAAYVIHNHYSAPDQEIKDD